MTNKTLLLSVSILAVSLLILSYALLRLTVELAATREESEDLVQRIETISYEVPRIAEVAGDQAARSAVKGAVDEVVATPLRSLMAMAQNPDTILPLPAEESATDGQTSTTIQIPPLPSIYVEFHKPKVYIEMSPTLDASSTPEN